MKTNNIQKVLELGAGHGRDTTFFASNGIEVQAVDYSIVAIEILDKITKEKRLPITPRIFDVRRALPFPDGYFDAVYSQYCLTCDYHLTSHFYIFRNKLFTKPKV